MTDKELDEIEARCRAATGGPWIVDHEVDDAGFEQRELWIIMRGQPTAYRFDRSEDAEFCAHARTDVPALLAEVRRLRHAWYAALAEVARLSEALDAAGKEEA